MLSRRRISYYVILLTQIITWSPGNTTSVPANVISSSHVDFSQPFLKVDGILPNTAQESTNEIFSNDGQFKIFARGNSVVDLRNFQPGTATTKSPHVITRTRSSITNESPLSSIRLQMDRKKLDPFKVRKDNLHSVTRKEAVKQIERFLLHYVQKMVTNSSYELFSGFRIDPDDTAGGLYLENRVKDSELRARSAFKTSNQVFNGIVLDQFKRFADSHVININVPRAVESGRLFFFKGLKKMMWTVFVGLQIVKTVLLALFLPSILGSLGKIVGKGITSVSGFNHATETVNDLDFKDNTYNLDQDNKFDDYMYPQPEASTNHFATQMYDSGAANTNNNALSRFGMGDQKLSYVNSGMNMLSSKNSNTDIMSTKKNNFKDFLDIPASSLLLTNYDPFYSPLLSRLDAVFQQLGLQKGNEICREKLVCLMYSSPAKYAPYSNLVSAQLSRELNELRKPTIDNPDILRFFKYMKSAKDGQDGMDCESIYKECTSLKDAENPAMLTTFNDINKLVQARKLK